MFHNENKKFSNTICATLKNVTDEKTKRNKNTKFANLTEYNFTKWKIADYIGSMEK